VPAAGREQFVPLMVDCFAQKASTPSTLAGTKVEVADRARTTNITVVGWTHGQVVVIVWANGVRATQQIAQQYVSRNPWPERLITAQPQALCDVGPGPTSARCSRQRASTAVSRATGVPRFHRSLSAASAAGSAGVVGSASS